MAFAKEYVRIGADELTKQAQTAMNIFYSDYTPQHYDRTYDLYSNSYSRYIHNNGSIYYGELRLVPMACHLTIMEMANLFLLL